MGGACPFGGSRRAIPREHLCVGPSGDSDEIVFLAACGEPSVGHRVPEKVRVQVVDAGLASATANNLEDAGASEAPLFAHPKPRFRRVGVGCAGPQVPIEGLRCLASEGNAAVFAPFAFDVGDLKVEVDVGNFKVRDF